MNAENKIKSEISEKGSITIDRFMESALFGEVSGYYRKKNPIGADSDFITSPEISVLFGEIIGLFIVNQIRENLSKYDKVNLVELGAGKGTLSNDVLNTIIKFTDIYQKLNVYILDINKVLIEMQKKTLIKHMDIVKWVERTEHIESDSPFIFLANEFFDALPVKQFVKRGDSIKERVIIIDNNKLSFSEKEAAVPKIISDFSDDYGEGDIIEYSRDSINYLSNICNILASNKGFSLIIDYGHTNVVSGDTLQSVYKHKYNNIFDNIGNADLTTHVNFRSLYDAALKLGVKDIQIFSQGEFLKSMGILTRAEMVSKNLNENQKKDLFMRVNRLISKEGMGNLFKCLILENF